MRILGIDPGFARMGWAIIDQRSKIKDQKQQGQEFKVQNYGCFVTDSKTEVSERLVKIYEKISKLIKKEKPDALSIEELFFNTNAKTAFLVGQARGVVILSASQNRIPIFIYTPLQVKIAVTGYGRAEKQQVGKMVKTILRLREIPKPDDAADALAIAITHAFSYKRLGTSV
ncbi:MAG: crossover junction endodeoxyribonuclease RuvC [Patescibacteria group bacterium]|nr:crossover junction endodeoxyribonuclease RuvC [Patescibacteria group bacterium]